MPNCPICGEPHQECGPPIGAALMGLVTSSNANPRGGAPMDAGQNITVTEPVYATTEDGARTYLAAAVGDELTPEQAEKLQVGADGKSSNGIQPAETLRVSDEVVMPGAAGQPAEGEEPAGEDAFDPASATGAQLDERYAGVEGYKKSASVADRQAWAAEYEASKAAEGEPAAEES